MELIKKINLVDELTRITNIPKGSGNTCHEDHLNMSDAIEDLINLIEKQEKGKCHSW